MTTFLYFLSIIAFCTAIYFQVKYKNQPKSQEEERSKAIFKEILSDLFNATDTVFAKGIGELKNIIDLSSTVDKLRDELSKLKIDKARIDENFARKEREIEHKVGLERSRQEQELRIERDRITVELGKANLETEKKSFQDMMKFHQDRFETEIKYQRELVEKMVKRFTIKDSNKESNI